MTEPKVRRKPVELPPRPFLYTIDQIATLLSVEPGTVKKEYLFYRGVSIRNKEKGMMLAVDIAPPDASRKEWRVLESELRRWCSYKGFRVSERGVW